MSMLVELLKWLTYARLTRINLEKGSSDTSNDSRTLIIINAWLVFHASTLAGLRPHLPGRHDATVPDCTTLNHDAEGLPLSGGFRYPESNAAFYIILKKKQNGSPIWLSGRLHVDGTAIAEQEIVIIRSGLGGSGFGAGDLAGVNPEWTVMVPPEQRNTRAELFDIADRFAETLQKPR